MGVENLGNIRLAPTATMALTDANGEEITDATIAMEPFSQALRPTWSFRWCARWTQANTTWSFLSMTLSTRPAQGRSIC